MSVVHLQKIVSLLCGKELRSKPQTPFCSCVAEFYIIGAKHLHVHCTSTDRYFYCDSFIILARNQEIGVHMYM